MADESDDTSFDGLVICWIQPGGLSCYQGKEVGEQRQAEHCHGCYEQSSSKEVSRRAEEGDAVKSSSKWREPIPYTWNELGEGINGGHFWN